jgi:hypothetical protein
MRGKKIDASVEDAMVVAAFTIRSAIALKVGQLLPRGAKKEIAQRAGVHITSVYKFFAGKHESEKIYSALVDYMKEYKKKTKNFIDTVGEVKQDN